MFKHVQNLTVIVPLYGRMRCICVKMSKLAVRIISFGDRKYRAFFVVSLLKLDAQNSLTLPNHLDLRNVLKFQIKERKEVGVFRMNQYQDTKSRN